MAVTPGGGDMGPGLGQGGLELSGVASGDGFCAGMEPDGGERVEDFATTEAVEGGVGDVTKVAGVGLGTGMKPGGGDNVAGLGAGIKPTTAGRDVGLEWEDLEEGVEIELSATKGDLTSCFLNGTELFDSNLTSSGFGLSLSSFVCSGSTFSSFLSFFPSDSTFSGRSSLRIRGRGSLVRPLPMRFVKPCEMSSLSSFLIASCLKEKAGILEDLETAEGADAGACFTGSSGVLFDVTAVTSSASVGRTFLTTRRTTLTTFLRVRPWSSVLSM